MMRAAVPSKALGELPPDIQAVLDKHFFGEAVKESKKIKKTLKQEYITDIHKESDEAAWAQNNSKKHESNLDLLSRS